MEQEDKYKKNTTNTVPNQFYLIYAGYLFHGTVPIEKIDYTNAKS